MCVEHLLLLLAQNAQKLVFTERAENIVDQMALALLIKNVVQV